MGDRATSGPTRLYGLQIHTHVRTPGSYPRFPRPRSTRTTTSPTQRERKLKPHNTLFHHPPRPARLMCMCVCVCVWLQARLSRRRTLKKKNARPTPKRLTEHRGASFALSPVKTQQLVLCGKGANRDRGARGVEGKEKRERKREGGAQRLSCSHSGITARLSAAPPSRLTAQIPFSAAALSRVPSTGRDDATLQRAKWKRASTHSSTALNTGGGEGRWRRGTGGAGNAVREVGGSGAGSRPAAWRQHSNSEAKGEGGGRRGRKSKTRKEVTKTAKQGTGASTCAGSESGVWHLVCVSMRACLCVSVCVSFLMVAPCAARRAARREGTRGNEQPTQEEEERAKRKTQQDVKREVVTETQRTDAR